MPTITIKNIPDALYSELKRSAKANHRSINKEVIACIERSTSCRRIDPKAILVQARQLREKTAKYIITDDDFTQAKVSGRP